MVEATTYIKKRFSLYFDNGGSFNLYQKRIFLVFWSWWKLPPISKKDFLCILIMVEASTCIKKGFSLYFVHGGSYHLYQKKVFLCILIMVEASTMIKILKKSFFVIGRSFIKKGFSMYFDHGGSYHLYQKKIFFVFW